jgi:hypothetical protein
MIKFLTNKNFSIEIENKTTLSMAITTSKANIYTLKNQDIVHSKKKNERTNKKIK